MIFLYALIEQRSEVDVITDYLRTQEISADTFFVDVNEGAQETADAHNLTVFPVLFNMSDANSVVVYGTEDSITSLSAEAINEIKAILVDEPVTPPSDS